MTNAASPVALPERIYSLDVLRGLALLGILVMNIQSFAMITAAYFNPTAYGDLTGANKWAWIVSHLLTAEKMYGLFSMLFGAGIVLMTERVAARGDSPRSLHYRRMGWLILFGLLHAHLFWYGDILYMYGMCGLLVYLFRNKPPRSLVKWSLSFFFIGSAIMLAGGLSMPYWGAQAVAEFSNDGWLPPRIEILKELMAYRGGWLEQAPVRSEQSLMMQSAVLFLFGWKTLGNMLLGMALFKWGVFSAQRSPGEYRRMAWLGFGIGLPIVAFGVWRNFAVDWDVRYSFFLGSQFNYWGSVIVDFGWIGLVMLMCLSPAFRGLKEALATIGRAAFSNYILQTILATTIFYGHGFGLFGSVERATLLLVVFSIWGVCWVFSRVWFRHFAFGPLEWAWRSLTYWKRMPLRINAGAAV